MGEAAWQALPAAVCIRKVPSNRPHRATVAETTELCVLLRVALIRRLWLWHPAFISHCPKAHNIALALFSTHFNELQGMGCLPVAEGWPLVVQGGKFLLLRRQEILPRMPLLREGSLVPRLHLQGLLGTFWLMRWKITPAPAPTIHARVTQPLERRTSATRLTVPAISILGLLALLRLRQAFAEEILLSLMTIALWLWRTRMCGRHRRRQILPHLRLVGLCTVAAFRQYRHRNATTTGMFRSVVAPGKVSTLWPGFVKGGTL